jgi:chromosome segregation ATPase
MENYIEKRNRYINRVLKNIDKVFYQYGGLTEANEAELKKYQLEIAKKQQEITDHSQGILDILGRERHRANNAEIDLKFADQEILNLQKQLDIQRNKADEAVAARLAIETDLTTVNAKLANSEAEVAGLKNQLAAARAEARAAAEAASKDAGNNGAAAAAALAAAQARTDAAEAALAAIKNKIGELTTELAEAKKQIFVNEKRLLTVTKDLHESTEKLRKTLDDNFAAVGQNKVPDYNLTNEAQKIAAAARRQERIQAAQAAQAAQGRL